VKPYYDEGGITIYHGDCHKVFEQLPRGHFDAVVTDPPYSSGALHIGGRGASTSTKYAQSGVSKFDDFEGDSRDGRSWKSWCADWLQSCLAATKPGGRLLVFSDWRQIPTITDAVQWAGWRWRGIIAWNKGRGARACHKGYFRSQCEFITWGTRGDLRPATWGGPWDGCITAPVLQRDKFHQTGKPSRLMTELLGCVPPGGRVLDPFMGSGTTLTAAKLLGLSAVGVELSEQNCSIAVERLRHTMAPRALKAAA
jgi:site-specific DNA-methyltransferase (adenine-specific)